MSKQQLEHVAGMVEKAVAEGAQIKTGGKVSSRTPGFHYEPTLIVNCRQDMEIIQQEIFGPVLPLMIFTNLELKQVSKTREHGSAAASLNPVWILFQAYGLERTLEMSENSNKISF